MNTRPAASKPFRPVDRRSGERLELRIDAATDIPRRRTWSRVVRDLTTGKRYRAWSKSCGLPRCRCDAYAEQLDDAPSPTRGQQLHRLDRTAVLSSVATMERLSDSTGILDAAADYARRGWPIVPLVGKVPAIRNWQRFDATPVNVRFWFGTRRCNVGLRTGGAGGYVVVDTDTAVAEEWVRSHLSDTPMVAVSGNGSTHRYYATPPRKEIRNKQGWNGIQGLDVRGAGGFIVLPGSIHPATGRPYEWQSDIWLPSGLPAFSPRWVYERRQRVQTAVADVLEPNRLLARGRQYVDKLPVAVSGANGHTTTFVAAIKIVKLVGFNRDAAWDLLRYYNATRCEPEWDEKSLRHKLDDALEYAR